MKMMVERIQREDSQHDEESEKFFKQNSIGLRSEIEEGTEKILLVVNYGKYVQNETGIWERHELDTTKRIHELKLSQTEGEVEVLDDLDSVEAKIWWKIYNRTVLNVFLENVTIWTEPDEKDDDKNSQKKETIDYPEATKRNNENTIFQPSISLQSSGAVCPFKPLSVNSKFYKSVEDDLFDMLYRNKKVFGSGYGCAAEWGEDDGPKFVRTVIIPTFEDDEIAKFTEDVDDPLKPARIDMYDLCCFEDLEDNDANRKTIKAKLFSMIEKYRNWILEQKKLADVEFAKNQYGEIAGINLKRCSEVLDRIEDGYQLLTDESEEDSNQILKAFILANRAMLYQRLHFNYSLNNFKNKKDAEWPDVKKPGQAFWHPFQMAFVLMSLRGIAFKNHPDNSVADLIWFPTGGGKTEAYLGVASFMMILRRLRRDVEDGLGVSVIMRYTLRLLTLQQFEKGINSDVRIRIS